MNREIFLFNMFKYTKLKLEHKIQREEEEKKNKLISRQTFMPLYIPDNHGERSENIIQIIFICFPNKKRIINIFIYSE